MGWTKSGLFVATAQDVFTDGAAINLDAEDHRIALFGAAVTPDYDVARAAAAYGAGVWTVANEVYGTGWAAGGVVLAGTTVTGSAGVLTWDAPDVSEDGTTLTDAAGALIYADALTTPQANQAIMGVYFGGELYSTVAGTFTVQFDPLGIITLRVVPA